MANELMNGRQNWLDNFGGRLFKNFGQQLLAISPETDNLLKTDVKRPIRITTQAVDCSDWTRRYSRGLSRYTLKISAKRDSFADHSDSQAISFKANGIMGALAGNSTYRCQRIKSMRNIMMASYN